MSEVERLQRIYDAHVACGDISGAGEAKMLAEIAAAQAQQRPSAAQDSRPGSR